MRNSTIALLAGAGSAALYSILAPATTPEHELMRTRRNRPAITPEPELAGARSEHVLGVDKAKQLQKIDAEGLPLVVWLELPAERAYRVRRASGTAVIRPVAERVEDGAHWLGFEIRQDGDVKLAVTHAGRLVTYFHVQAKNVRRRR